MDVEDLLPRDMVMGLMEVSVTEDEVCDDKAQEAEVEARLSVITWAELKETMMQCWES